MSLIGSFSVHVTVACITPATKGVPSVSRMGLNTVSKGNRSTGNVRKNSPFTIQSLSVAAIFLATFRLDSVFKPMRETEGTPFVAGVMHAAVTCTENEPIRDIASRIVTRSVNHIVVVDEQGKIAGIVTSWDITRAMAEGRKALADVVSRRVVTAKPDEPLEIASKRMAKHNISALPVVDNEGKVLGIVTSEDVSKLLGR